MVKVISSLKDWHAWINRSEEEKMWDQLQGNTINIDSANMSKGDVEQIVKDVKKAMRGKFIV